MDGDVLGQVDEHRAGPPLLGDLEGKTHRGGEVGYILDDEVVLGDRHRDPGDIDLLEAVLAQKREDDVAGEGHERHTIHVGGGDAGHQVRRPGAAGGDADTDLAGRACIPIGGVGCPLFVAGEDVADPVAILVEGFIERQHRPSGKAEDRIDTLLHQTLYDDLCSTDLHHSLLLLIFKDCPACST